MAAFFIIENNVFGIAELRVSLSNYECYTVYGKHTACCTHTVDTPLYQLVIKDKSMQMNQFEMGKKINFANFGHFFCLQYKFQKQNVWEMSRSYWFASCVYNVPTLLWFVAFKITSKNMQIFVYRIDALVNLLLWNVVRPYSAVMSVYRFSIVFNLRLRSRRWKQFLAFLIGRNSFCSIFRTNV